MTAICPIHPTEELIEREGQYGVFFSHKTDDPDYPKGYCNGKRVKTVMESPAYQNWKSTGESLTHREAVKEDKPDWDEIAKGKVRHGIAVAFIERGEELTESTKTAINDWVEFVMKGQ